MPPSLPRSSPGPEISMRAWTRWSGVCLRNTLISGSPPWRLISSTRRRASAIASSSVANFSLPTLDPCRTVTFQLTGTQTSLGYCAAMPRENVEVVREAFRLWGLNPEGGLAPIDLDRLEEVSEGDT